MSGPTCRLATQCTQTAVKELQYRRFLKCAQWRVMEGPGGRGRTLPLATGLMVKPLTMTQSKEESRPGKEGTRVELAIDP